MNNEGTKSSSEIKYKPTFWFTFTLYTSFLNTFINKVLFPNPDIKQYIIESALDFPDMKMVQFQVRIFIGNNYRNLTWQFAVDYEDLWNIGASKYKDDLDKINATNLMALDFIEKCKQEVKEKIEYEKYLHPEEFEM